MSLLDDYNKYKKKYESLKESGDPDGAILNKHLNDYKRKLNKLFGGVPTGLIDFETLMEGRPDSITKEKDLSSGQLYNFAVKYPYSKAVLSKLDNKQRSTLMAMSGKFICHYFDGKSAASIDTNREFTLMSGDTDLNIAIFAILKRNITFGGVLYIFVEGYDKEFPFLRGPMMMYLRACSEIEERQKQNNEMFDQFEEINNLEDGEYPVNKNIGWATVVSYNVSGGEIVSVKVNINNKVIVYTSRTGSDALKNTIKDLAKNKIITYKQFAKETATSKIIADALGYKFAKSSSISDLIKLANHLDKINFTKEADFLDSIINKYAESLVDQLQGENPDETEESDDNSADDKIGCGWG